MRSRAVRTGRPPRERAGDVDARILDAAQCLFLERGLAGTSVDEIARSAWAGKPTIYARFPDKETLFTAVVMRDLHAGTVRKRYADRSERRGAPAFAFFLLRERLKAR
jgi:AcrR family transcriptional regulator